VKKSAVQTNALVSMKSTSSRNDSNISAGDDSDEIDHNVKRRKKSRSVNSSSSVESKSAQIGTQSQVQNSQKKKRKKTKAKNANNDTSSNSNNSNTNSNSNNGKAQKNTPMTKTGSPAMRKLAQATGSTGKRKRSDAVEVESTSHSNADGMLQSSTTPGASDAAAGGGAKKKKRKQKKKSSGPAANDGATGLPIAGVQVGDAHVNSQKNNESNNVAGNGPAVATSSDSITANGSPSPSGAPPTGLTGLTGELSQNQIRRRLKKQKDKNRRKAKLKAAKRQAASSQQPAAKSPAASSQQSAVSSQQSAVSSQQPALSELA
jgi:hypothetical protein